MLLLSRRLRYELARVAGRRALERERTIRLDVLPYALLDRDGVVSFAAAAGDNTGVGRIVDEGTAAVQVRAVRLDDALEKAGIARVDAIKLDVEGAEAAALAGAAETLRRHRPAVLFEVNEVTRENGVFTAPAIDVLRVHGYAIHAIAEDGLVELDPEVDPRPYAERWHALNLVALHRRSSR